MSKKVTESEAIKKMSLTSVKLTKLLNREDCWLSSLHAVKTHEPEKVILPADWAAVDVSSAESIVDGAIDLLRMAGFATHPIEGLVEDLKTFPDDARVGPFVVLTDLLRQTTELSTSLAVYSGRSDDEPTFEIVPDVTTPDRSKAMKSWSLEEPSPIPRHLSFSGDVDQSPSRAPVGCNGLAGNEGFQPDSAIKATDVSGVTTNWTISTDRSLEQLTHEMLLKKVDSGEITPREYMEFYRECKSEKVSPSVKSAEPHVIAVITEEIKDFRGTEELDTAKAWIKKLQQRSRNEKWDLFAFKNEFSTHLIGSAKKWYQQLPKVDRQSEKMLVEKFVKEYCEGSVSKRNQYYRLRQVQRSPLDYLYALNAAAKKAHIDYENDEDELKEHVEQYFDTITNKTLASTLRLVTYKSMEQLVKAVKSWDKGQRKNMTYNIEAPRRPNPSVNPHQPQQPLRPRVNTFEPTGVNESVAEFARALVQAIQSGTPAAAPSGGQYQHQQRPPRGRQSFPKFDPCPHCQKTNHPPERCFKVMKCPRCGQQGHSLKYCRNPPVDHGNRNANGNAMPILGQHDEDDNRDELPKE